jgi:hypothetical protein
MVPTRQQNHVRLRARNLDSDDGVQFVRCSICRDRLRVISGLHLSKHETDRETFMEEYGLSPDELIAKDFRMIQSSRRGYFPHGKRDWIAAIKKVYTRDRDITQKYLRDKHPHLYVQGVRIFGDWDKALRAAGFDPEQTRIKRAWDEEAIIRGIRRLRDRKLPLFASYVMKNHAGLCSKALRKFGSWGNALVAAGVAKETLSGHLHGSRLGVLKALREVLENRSKYDIPKALRSQAEYYFGSLPKAIVA